MCVLCSVSHTAHISSCALSVCFALGINFHALHVVQWLINMYITDNMNVIIMIHVVIDIHFEDDTRMMMLMLIKSYYCICLL